VIGHSGGRTLSSLCTGLRDQGHFLKWSLVWVKSKDCDHINFITALQICECLWLAVFPRSRLDQKQASQRLAAARTPPPTPTPTRSHINKRSTPAGLKYQRPSFTFDSAQWEPLALSCFSAEARGYVYGCAGHRETNDKNIATFRKWFTMPRRAAW
jgi:hypothetical protein